MGEEGTKRMPREVCEQASEVSNPTSVQSPDVTREVFGTWLGIFFTLAFLGIGLLGPARDFARRIHTSTPGFAIEDALVILIVCFYVWGQLIYEWCRLGYLKRLAEYQTPSLETLETTYDCESAQRLVVLVPSFCEPVHVVRMTLMAAALMEHPNREVVLLIDNPPDASDPAAVLELAETRQIVQEIETTLRQQERRYTAELSAYHHRRARGRPEPELEGRRIATLHAQAAQWFEEQVSTFDVNGYAAALFVDRILREPAIKHRARASEILQYSRDRRFPFSEEYALHEYRRLAARFGAHVSCFERKCYENLSHVKNKAMNLNSYLGLLGGNFRSVVRVDGTFLERCELDEASLSFGDADYIIICDADTLLLGDYALKLFHVMQQPGAERIGVAQAPSLAVPGNSSLVQRIAGADTDLHRILCLGSSHYGAAFWLGSNGLIRRQALEDIGEISSERGYPIRKYIRDRTLVEDTEATIDFLVHGWEIHNLLDPLAYRGTPSDYGSLLIQRRRWAGGGLVNLPKFLRYLLGASDWPERLPEMLLRLQQLGAQAVNLGGLLLPLLALAKAPARGWWLWIAAPYYALCWRDLRASGYKSSDFPRLLALNLLLISVNVAGTCSALFRALTGRERTFYRTPKSKKRIPTPVGYALAAVLLPIVMAIATVWNATLGEWSFAVLCSFNTILLGYGLLRFVGFRAAVEDILAGVRRDLADG